MTVQHRSSPIEPVEITHADLQRAIARGRQLRAEACAGMSRALVAKLRSIFSGRRHNEANPSGQSHHMGSAA